MYIVEYDDKAARFVLCLSQELKNRIFYKIRQTKENPFRYFKRLEGRKDYSLRVGEYRVIADIDIQLKKIEVRLVGHRKNVYEK